MSSAIDKLGNSNEIVNANTRIHDAVYELNATTVSDAQVEFASDPEKNTHTNNGINQQNLLSSRMVGIRHKEVSVFTPSKGPSIGTKN